jgi:hypothetical protein
MGEIDFLIQYLKYSKVKNPVEFNKKLLVLALIIGIIAFSYVDKFTKNIAFASIAFISITVFFIIGLGAKEEKIGEKN